MRVRADKRNYGDVRYQDGAIHIYNEKGWALYPPHATELIEFAQDRGWLLVSNGLPVRTNSDGDLIIAVTLMRLPDEHLTGISMRVSWVCEHTTFHIGKILYRVTRRPWRELRMLREARNFIHEHRARPERVSIR